MITIHLRLKEHRKRFKLKQSQIAWLLGIKTHKYIKYEKGEEEPPLRILISLADLYNIEITELYDATVEPSFKKLYEECKAQQNETQTK